MTVSQVQQVTEKIFCEVRLTNAVNYRCDVRGLPDLNIACLRCHTPCGTWTGVSDRLMAGSLGLSGCCVVNIGHLVGHKFCFLVCA